MNQRVSEQVTANLENRLNNAQKSAKRPYPTEAFGPIAQGINAMAASCQVDPEMVGTLVLGCVSAASQALVNVSDKRFDAGCPVTINVFMVAASGERKSSVVSTVFRPMYDAVTNFKDNRRHMIYNDVTVDGMIMGLINGCPARVVVAPEASVVLGGYAMSKDHTNRFLGTASSLYSGEVLTRTRKDEDLYAPDRRLSMTLLAQRGLAMEFLSHEMVMEQGMGNRFLYSAPSSLVGVRLYSDVELDQTSEYLDYCERITKIMEQPWALHPQTGGVKARTLRLSPEAKEAWVQVYNLLETESAPGGQYADRVSYTSRFAEQIKRISALLTMLKDPTADEVDEESMLGAIDLGDYYFHVARALFTEMPANKDELDAFKVLEWMRQYQLSQQVPSVPMREIYRGPQAARSKERAQRLLELLVEREEVEKIEAQGGYGSRRRGGDSYAVVNL